MEHRVIDRPGPGAGSGGRAGRRLFARGLGVAVAAVIAATVGIAGSAHAGAGTSTLNVNETLGVNQSLFSPNRSHEAKMQSDGNLVVYGPGGPIWSSNTRGTNARLVMQGDSNLVMYSDQGVLFATGKVRAGSNRLIMQDDGNLVLYGSGDLWASKSTAERAIQWFYSNAGRRDYEGRCEAAVENAFGKNYIYATAAARPTATPAVKAKANWNNRTQRSPYSDAPRGALVFYNTSVSGHVAISVGNGQVVSTAAGGQIGIKPINYFQQPYGWAYAPW
jgi:hypothetical protein